MQSKRILFFLTVISFLFLPGYGVPQKINFQPADSTVPDGYELDDGSWYETHGDYGWVTDDDTDGLPDWWEVKYFGTMDYGSGDDYDDDGLNNGDELGRGTNPADVDTDIDGWEDGYEVTEGADPLNSSSYPTPGVFIFSPEDGDEV